MAATYTGSSSRDAIRDVVLVEIPLTLDGEDLVLGPEGPDGIPGHAVEGHDPTQAGLTAVEVNITDNVGNVVAIRTYE